MKKRRQTAEELMAELQSNPKYRRRMKQKQRDQQKRWKQIDDELAPVICKLNECGCQGASVGEIVRRHAPLPGDAVEILLNSLDVLRNDRAVETIVRALGATRVRFDGRPLVQKFQSTADEAVKWAIVNTISLTKPHFINEWIEQLLMNDYWKQTLYGLGWSFQSG